jgi:hypothetical protein
MRLGRTLVFLCFFFFEVFFLAAARWEGLRDRLRLLYQSILNNSQQFSTILNNSQQ